MPPCLHLKDGQQRFQVPSWQSRTVSEKGLHWQNILDKFPNKDKGKRQGRWEKPQKTSRSLGSGQFFPKGLWGSCRVRPDPAPGSSSLVPKWTRNPQHLSCKEEAPYSASGRGQGLCDSPLPNLSVERLSVGVERKSGFGNQCGQRQGKLAGG